MEEEDLLFDLAWKEVESTYKYIETIDTKAQMMIIVISIVLPLLISNIPGTSLIIYLILIASFGLAFFSIIEYIEKLDNRLDDMIKFVNQGYSAQTKMDLINKFRKTSLDLKVIRDKKLKLYAWSGSLFVSAILLLIAEIAIFKKMV